MKKTAVYLVLAGVFVFAIKFTFAQEVKSTNEDYSFSVNQDAWSNTDAVSG